MKGGPSIFWLNYIQSNSTIMTLQCIEGTDQVNYIEWNQETFANHENISCEILGSLKNLPGPFGSLKPPTIGNKQL